MEIQAEIYENGKGTYLFADFKQVFGGIMKNELLEE